MKKLLIILLFLAISTVVFAQKDTLYYNGDWDEVSKEYAKYYRPLPLNRSGKNWVIKDYYINGNLQFEGFTKEVGEDVLVGEAIWYDIAGKVESSNVYESESIIYHSGDNITADYIVKNKGYLLKELKDNIEVKKITTSYHVDNKKMKIAISSYYYKDITAFLEKEDISKENIKKITSLKEHKYNSLVKELNGIEFESIDDEDKNNKEVLSFSGNDFFSSTYLTRKSDKKWEVYSVEFAEVYPVKINNKYVILLLSHSYYDYLFPFKDEIIIDDFSITTTRIKNTKNDFDEYYKYNFEADDYFSIFTENSKIGLEIKGKKKPVIAADYDSILYKITPYIQGYKDNQIHLFYRNADKVSLEHIRAIYTGKGNRTSVLSGNAIYWLHKGVLTDSIPEHTIFLCGTVSSFSHEIVNSTDDYYLNIKKGMMGENKTEASMKLFSSEEFKSVLCLNNMTTDSWDENDMFIYEYYLPLNYFLVKTNNGKSGIIKVDWEYESEIKYEYVLNPDDYEVTANGYNSPVKIVKDGLIGLWPLNNRPKYLELSALDKYFYRFKDADGNYGWLSLNGNEYYDE